MTRYQIVLALLLVVGGVNFVVYHGWWQGVSLALACVLAVQEMFAASSRARR